MLVVVDRDGGAQCHYVAMLVNIFIVVDENGGDVASCH